MNAIYLNEILFKDNSLEFKHSATGVCAQYIKRKLHIEYEGVNMKFGNERAHAMATCTWLGSGFLLLSWLFDVYVDILDASFHQSIQEMKQGFKDMYPALEFNGRLHVQKLLGTKPPKLEEGQTAVFYSGGVDSTYTLIENINKSPTLATIWGADLEVTAAQGWEKMKQNTLQTASHFNLPYLLIKSNLRVAFDEFALNKHICQTISTWWWPGFSHGAACVSLLAPLLDQLGLSVIYFASSFTLREKGRLPWGSDPTIEERLRFGNCRVVHHAYEVIRQKKVKSIVKTKQETSWQVRLKVCASDTGTNCCNCHNCYLTMIGLMVYNEDPAAWGFDEANFSIEQMIDDLNHKIKYEETSRMFWNDMQKEGMGLGSLSSNLSFFEKMYFENPKQIVAVACVYNESDIIESFCRYHCAIFDALVLYDRNSVDGSTEIIRRLIIEGLPIHLITDLQPHPTAKTYKAALSDFAFKSMKAEVVFPLDPDEFLCQVGGGNPREELVKLKANKEYHVPWRTAIYERAPEDGEFVPSSYRSFREPQFEKFLKPIVSKNIYEQYGAVVGRGVHQLDYAVKPDENFEILMHDKLFLAHYPVRSSLQMLSKIVPARLDHKYKNDDPNLGFHQGIIYETILQKGLLGPENLRQLSLEYALVKNNLAEEILSSKADFESSFVKDLRLRYTDNSPDTRLAFSLKIILNHFEQISDLYKADQKTFNNFKFLNFFTRFFKRK